MACLFDVVNAALKKAPLSVDRSTEKTPHMPMYAELIIARLGMLRNAIRLGVKPKDFLRDGDLR